MSKQIGFKQIVDPYCYSYSLDSAKQNTDPYVRKALKLFNYEHYKSLFGYTKLVDMDLGMQNIQLFGAAEKRKDLDQWSSKDHCIYNRVVRKVTHQISKQPIPLASFEDVFENIENLQASAGFSFPGLKKGEVIEEAFYMSRNILHRMKYGYKIYTPPAKLAFRGHLSELTNIKVRPVWNLPFEWLMLESIFSRNVYKQLKESGRVLHFGENSMKKLSRLLNHNLRLYKELAITLDWKGFDHHMPAFVIEKAFDILEQVLDFTSMSVRDKVIHFSDPKAQQYKQAFYQLKDYFINTKIMLPDGTCIQKNRGIPSGSQFTQLIGSICNMIIVGFIFEKQSIRILRSRYLGDDSLVFICKHMQKHFNINTAIKDALDYFNMELHHDKVRITSVNGKIKFLGYEASGRKYIRQDDEFFKSALYPERLIRRLSQSATRMLAYYLIGGNNDIQFASFFRYYRKAYNLTSFIFDPENYVKRIWQHVLGRKAVRQKLSKIDEIGTMFNLSLNDQYTKY